MENSNADGKEVLYSRSMKKKTKTGSDSASVTEDDIWDDSVLVEAYDKAVDEAQAKVLKQALARSKAKLNKNNQKRQWHVGDFCRCEYSEDHLFYEAKITDIIGDLGMCVVKYVGYENEEKVSLSKLKPSKGEVIRSMQEKQAEQEKNAMDEASLNEEPGPSNPPQQVKKKTTSKKSENAKAKGTASAGDMNPQCPTSHMFKPTIMGAIPPPPPPHVFTKLDDNAPESDAMSAMLMSWYMSGYHTGYYQGLKATKK